MKENSTTLSLKDHTVTSIKRRLESKDTNKGSAAKVDKQSNKQDQQQSSNGLEKYTRYQQREMVLLPTTVDQGVSYLAGYNTTSVQ
jgi:hypothetical protein